MLLFEETLLSASRALMSRALRRVRTTARGGGSAGAVGTAHYLKFSDWFCFRKLAKLSSPDPQFVCWSFWDSWTW
jgi:hypothetical protein